MADNNRDLDELFYDYNPTSRGDETSRIWTTPEPSDDDIYTSSPVLTAVLPLIRDADRSGADGYLGIRRYERLVVQNFKNLILTSPGEKITDPEFGVGLRNFLFENYSDKTLNALKSKITTQKNRYLSYIDILEYKFRAFDLKIGDNQGLSVYIQFFIRPLRISSELEVRNI